MQIKAKTKFLHSIGAITDAEARAEREKADMNRSNYYKNISRRGATNVWENAKKFGKTHTYMKYGPEFIHNGKRYRARLGRNGYEDPTKTYNRDLNMLSRYELKNGYKGQRLHGSETYIMNKQDTNATNNFNAKELAQKKAPGGMAVWGGRKGKTRRNRKNRRGTRKN